MLAEARPVESESTWKPSTSGKDHSKYQQASSQRSCFLGLETRPELVWDEWEVGREFTKTLVLKNIHSKLHKLHLRPPVSRFFSTVTPKVIFVSPGTCFSIPVTFRPLQKREYEDSIEFQSKDGSFQVYLRAIICGHALQLPESVQLPLCAVQSSTQTTFLIHNPSKLPTCFQWEFAPPFQLIPERGLLMPGQGCQMTVDFQPQEALVYQKQAYCRFGDEGEEADNCCTVLLQGLAKYPCVQLRNPTTTNEKDQDGLVLNFGSVAVDQSSQKSIEIFNPSPVSASFSISRLPGWEALQGSEFSFDVTSGTVEPGGSLQATVVYKPTVVDTVSVEYLSLRCKGGLSTCLLKIIGNCIGPKVSLSTSLVDFRCVKEGETVAQTLVLVNSSPVQAIYQWDLDNSGYSVFSIEPAGGTVRPHSRTRLRAAYKPTLPIAHYRRVACCILHGNPLFLDLIGTCHSEEQQPVVLEPEHLILYKLHWYSRDSLGVMLQERILDLEQQEAIFSQNSSKIADSSAAVSNTPMEDYFQFGLGDMDASCTSSSASLSQHVSVSPKELLFNHKTPSALSASPTSSQAVSITNHTRMKLSLAWTVVPDSPFSISPSSFELASLKSTSFRVTYNPRQLNMLHGAQLECFAYYKQGNLHVRQPLLCPPWCVTVRVIGHSFQPCKDHFVPHCSLKPHQVAFPGLSVLSYRTVLLCNHGNLPLTFYVNPHLSSNPALAALVSALPSCGLIQPGDHQILTLRTTPKEESPKEGFMLPLQLNATRHKRELTIVSAVETLNVIPEADGNLCFQPTAVGSRNQHPYHIKNICSLPLGFRWSIPESDKELISVAPDTGELQPNESLFQTWSFSPLLEKTYSLKATLTIWPLQTPECNTSHLTLKVLGTSFKGFVEAQRAIVDVEDTVVGGHRSFDIPLKNNSPCPVSFTLSAQQTVVDKQLPQDHTTEPNALHFDFDSGTIASFSTMLVRSTFRPHRRGQYQWIISYQTVTTDGFASSAPQTMCEVRAKGVFPTLQVINACSGGSVGRISRAFLQKLFSLDNLNEELISNPTPGELIYRTPTRHSVRSCPSVLTKALLDLDLSAAPLNSEPSVFELVLYNPGWMPVDWAFLFPEDQQIELEYWTETAEFTSAELRQMMVLDNRLFDISPRSGTLLPSQQMAVQFSYSHDYAGKEQFPIVFKLSYGREILLNIQGTTVKRDMPYLHFPSKNHVFTPVTIGDLTPPIQVFEVYNGGTVPVHYEVDTDVLTQLQDDNFNHPVLCCLNPVGDVLPGRMAMLEFIFSPLEAKLYYTDVSIRVQNGDSTVVRFEGRGVNAPTLTFSQAAQLSNAKPSIPSVQRKPFPGQLVFLSEDIISLGDIPVCSRSSRILFLTNLSHTETVLYSWDLQSSHQLVQIQPEQGSVRPGESVLCVITFTSTDYPTIYQLDIICQLTEAAALAQYHDALQRWEREKVRQQDEFTITDRGLTPSQIVLTDKASIAAPIRRGPPIRQYKTLPPICASSRGGTLGAICTSWKRAERQAQRETTKVWNLPEPPQPALVHVEVTARSHGPLEYLTHFLDLFNRHQKCLQSIKPQRPESTSFSPAVPAGRTPSAQGPARDVQVHVLSSLIRGILADEDFAQSLRYIATRPITYLPQGAAASPPRPQSSPPPSPQPQALTTEANPEVEKQHSSVDSIGIAGCPENRPRTQALQRTIHMPADMCEDILLNTLQNLMMEAIRGELILTAHPRSVTLPPISNRSRRVNHDRK